MADVTVSQIAAALAAIRSPVAKAGVSDPITDASGRQHAPFDGWTDEGGRVYRGGEYLPDDFSREYRVRMLVSSDAADCFRDAVSDCRDVIGVDFGAEFDGLTYAYITARKAAAEILSRIAPAERELVLASSGLPVGKTWKYSYKRDMAAAVRDNDPTRPLREDFDKQMVGYYRPRIIPE